ncbi:SEC20 [Candida margitis]|uniref:SEC20 n=1 Tax=Candida margitis TaxID=1775924 RepID=UPI002226FE96|nr:SEC20 [Candida margitis]KAI5968078.1 SEC20 [Candida margitis]
MDIPTRLDHLQKKVYSDFDSLLQTLSIQNDDNSPKTIRTRINQNLLEFKDYLHILKSSTKEDSTYHIYDLKYKSLKQKFRKVQLYLNEEQQVKIQEYRLLHFNLLPDTDNSTDNESNERPLQSTREQLFSNRSSQKTADASISQQINQQNTKITSSLQKSRDLLSTTILQSELNIDSIDQQTKDLTKLNESFIQFSDLLNKSRGIIKFIEKQDKSDRQRIYLSMGFFILCCCWVLYRRVLRRPISILFWSFFKIFNIFNWILGTRSRMESANEKVESLSVIASTTAELLSTALSAASEDPLSETLQVVISSITTSARFVDEL